MSDAELERLRGAIDEIDEQLRELLNRRARLALAAGRAKATAGRPVHDPNREQRILERLRAAQATAPRPVFPAEPLADIFSRVLEACRRLQEADPRSGVDA